MAKKRRDVEEEIQIEKEIESFNNIEYDYLDEKFQAVKESEAIIKKINETYFLRVRLGRIYNPYPGALDNARGHDYNVSQFPWRAVSKRAYMYYSEYLKSKDSIKLLHAERTINA